MSKDKKIREVGADGGAIVTALRARLEGHDNNRKVVQEGLASVCSKFRSEIGEFEERLSTALEENFSDESSRLQSALNFIAQNDEQPTSEAIQTVKAVLSKKWSCNIKKEALQGCALNASGLVFLIF